MATVRQSPSLLPHCAVAGKINFDEWLGAMKGAAPPKKPQASAAAVSI